LWVIPSNFLNLDSLPEFILPKYHKNPYFLFSLKLLEFQAANHQHQPVNMTAGRYMDEQQQPATPDPWIASRVIAITHSEQCSLTLQVFQCKKWNLQEFCHVF
jgi:hypothetical protein